MLPWLRDIALCFPLIRLSIVTQWAVFAPGWCHARLHHVGIPPLVALHWKPSASCSFLITIYTLFTFYWSCSANQSLLVAFCCCATSGGNPPLIACASHPSVLNLWSPTTFISMLADLINWSLSNGRQWMQPTGHPSHLALVADLSPHSSMCLKREGEGEVLSTYHLWFILSVSYLAQLANNHIAWHRVPDTISSLLHWTPFSCHFLLVALCCSPFCL